MSVPALRISKILDKYTLVAVGENTDPFTEGFSALVVTEVGKLDSGPSIVLPKAELKVSLNAGFYVVPSSTNEVTAFDFSKIVRQQRLLVNESQMSGNPATREIELGDVVILKNDLRNYA